MKLFFILGNQLFPIQNLNSFKNDHIIFMAEDYELCTYEKHHKLKILLFLSAMRSHADNLKKNKFKVEYNKIESIDFKKDYLEKAKKELEDIQGPLYKKVVGLLGIEETIGAIDIWKKLIGVLEKGEHRPGHFKARKC